MALFARVAVLAIVTLVFTVPAQANWLRAFCRHIAQETNRRHHWPKPYCCLDRQTVGQPFAIMISNGWRSQNMLGDHHFEDQRSEITEAGRRKVYWILTEAPLQQRIVYVHQAVDPEVTAARVANTERLVDQFAGSCPRPQVLPTSVRAPGWPAAEVNLIGRNFEASMPEPRLPVPSMELSTEQ